MTAYTGQTWTTLDQLCAALWDSQSRPVVIQTGIDPGSVVTPQALRYSALDRCATREPSIDEDNVKDNVCHPPIQKEKAVNDKKEEKKTKKAAAKENSEAAEENHSENGDAKTNQVIYITILDIFNL